MIVIKRKFIFSLIGTISCIIILNIWYQSHAITISISPYPYGMNFAFTIVDDPDGTELEKIRPIYRFLDDIGLKTTICCWIFKPIDVSGMPDPEEQLKSDTLENKKYLEFLKEMRTKGFEVALHTVTAGNDIRQVTIDGYERFREFFGIYPKINVMHSRNKENIYWGKNVFANPLLQSIVGFYSDIDYGGEKSQSQYFWGDICHDKTKYVRLWGTSSINTAKFNPSMPYHDNKKPYVNFWFSFSDGYNVKYFKRLISKNNIKKLIKERGSCIVYTHFAAGFSKKQPDGTYILDDKTKEALLFIAQQKDGWFIPTGELLDRLLQIKRIILKTDGTMVKLTNQDIQTIKAVTLVSKPYMNFIDPYGNVSQANEEGEIIIGDLEPQVTKTIIFKDKISTLKIPQEPNLFERINLVWERLKIFIFEHRG